MQINPLFCSLYTVLAYSIFHAKLDSPSVISVNRRWQLVWFCMPETFQKERERERERESRRGSRRGRLRRRQSIEVVRKVGRRHLFPSELKSVSQSVGYVGRGNRLKGHGNAKFHEQAPSSFLTKRVGLSLFWLRELSLNHVL